MKRIKRQIGVINESVINKLGLTCQIDTPIFIGDSNIEHMQNTHEYEYEVYGSEIDVIISQPDYIGLNKDGSIEYVKDYLTANNEYVKLAVRVTGSGQYFARTLYVLNTKRVNDFIAKGALIKY